MSVPGAWNPLPVPYRPGPERGKVVSKGIGSGGATDRLSNFEGPVWYSGPPSCRVVFFCLFCFFYSNRYWIRLSSPILGYRPGLITLNALRSGRAANHGGRCRYGLRGTFGTRSSMCRSRLIRNAKLLPPMTCSAASSTFGLAGR